MAVASMRAVRASAEVKCVGGDGDNVTISTISHHLALASTRMWGCKWGEGNGQGEMCSSGHNDDVRSTTVHLSCHHHCYMAVVGT